MSTWSDGVGVAWNAWGTHWPVDVTTHAAGAALTTVTTAVINWGFFITAVPVTGITTQPANINERWRVEPTAIPSSVMTPDANINWKNYTITTPLTAIVPTAASINWKNYTTCTPLPAMSTRTANINLRWRVEPSALTSGLSTRDAAPGAYVFSLNGLKLTTFPVGPITTIDAFIRVGPWPDVDPILYIDILAEDRVINIPAEDRSIQVEAEGRTITIRM